MKLCIIIIGRNDAGHLKRSITAASSELKGYEGCRVLYADDHSDDGSDDLARAIASKLGNVDVFVSPVQRNIGGIRNAAIDYLSTQSGVPEYVWFNDSDDYVTPGSAKRVLDAIARNKEPDCVSIPLYTLRDESAPVPPCPVMQNTLEEAPFGPVSECAYVFKTSLYVRNPEGQRCEDCPWHFAQFDRFNTWAKVDGDAPCYVWDNTNLNATSRTVDYCGSHSITLISAALDNVLIRDGKNDQWVSDNLRNIANMYDVRRILTKPSVRAAWEMRFRQEVSNFMNGWHIH